MLNLNPEAGPDVALLDLSRFGKEFDTAWDGLSQRFFKFEAQQYYDEGDDGPYHDYLQGRLDAFIEKVVSLRKEDEPYFQRARANGASFVRVHAIRTPITPYLQYEFHSYVLSEAIGERVLVVDCDVVQELFGESVPDFVLFDDSVAFLQGYDDGRLVNARRVTGEAIQTFVTAANLLLPLGKPFTTLDVLDPVLVERLRRQFAS